jgi:glycosyltransferase involved in cell wall biosynthesis
MDADLSHDPKYLPAMIERAEGGADLVIGSRYLNGISVVNWPLRRIILSQFANFYIRTVTGLHMRDVTTGYRCWRRASLAKLPLDRIVSNGYAFLLDVTFMAADAGLTIVESPIIFIERPPGLLEAVGRRPARVAVDAVEADHAARPHQVARRIALTCRRCQGSVSFFRRTTTPARFASLVITSVKVAATLTDDFEVIVIDDGSADDTPQILDELARIYPDCVRIVHHGVNRGYGGALRAGFSTARKDFVFYTDGDAQYDPSEMTLLWHKMTDDVDWVNGWKISRSDPLHRIIIGRVYHHMVKLLFGLKVRDVDCDFRLMRRRIFDVVRLEKNSGVICLEMMKKFQDAGFRVAEHPVHHYHRSYGKSQFFNFPRIYRTAIDVMKLWWMLVVRKEHLKR